MNEKQQDVIRFYLDNNALQKAIKIEDNNNKKKEIYKLFYTIMQSLKEHVFIPYSTAHLSDLMKNWNRLRRAPSGCV